ncbi:hypothetical protein [Amycolatopsis sp. cmx-11-32]|uniref:hypothetical protein n=1 Tax=Amycolatopsis sp. cmx-11-32 TaxID=2785796 RepID=UPI0039E6A024
MTDPYGFPDGKCLRNKLDIEDPEAFKQVEARIVSIRDVELARQSLPGDSLMSGHRRCWEPWKPMAGCSA